MRPTLDLNRTEQEHASSYGSKVGVRVPSERATISPAAPLVRDEEAAGSNPATPTTETAGHGISGDLLSLFATPSVRFWEPDGSGRSSLQSRQGHRREAVQAAAQALFDNHMLAKLGVPSRGRKTS